MQISLSGFKNSSNISSAISFRGVSLGDFNGSDSFEYANNSNDEDNDIAKKFELGLKNIKENCEKKKEQVTGLFKKRKKAEIEKETDDKISGFLSAQEISIETQDKVVRLLEEKVKMMQDGNVKLEELAEAKKALLLAKKIKEKAELIASNKDKHKGFDSIAGYENEKFILTDNFINMLPLEMAGQDVEFPNGILFFGPVGNGKTSFAKAFATSAGCNFAEAKSSKIARGKKDREESFYKDLTSKAENAQQNFLDNGKRTIILVDEIDRFAYEGSSISAKLKRFLESCSKDYHSTVFATTNNPLVIPSPILGAKRMPVKVCIDPPDETNAALVLRHYLESCDSVDLKDEDYEELAGMICAVLPDRAYNNSQIENICTQCIENCDSITKDDVAYYINREVPGVDKESMTKYKKEKEILIGEED